MSDFAVVSDTHAHKPYLVTRDGVRVSNARGVVRRFATLAEAEAHREELEKTEMSDNPKNQKGCDLCEDSPVELRGSCHPTAPVRASMERPGELVLRCYVPSCNRVVAVFNVATIVL